MPTCDTSDAVNDVVNHLLADGIVTTSIVVGGILLSADEKLGVEELAVSTGADLVDRGRVKVDEDGSGNMLATAGLSEEGLKRSSITDVLGVGIRATVSSEAVLEEVARS
jgi:hypothetical protein